MRDYYFDEAYRLQQSFLTKLSWKKGEHDSIRKVVIRRCIREGCQNNFKTTPSDPKKFCSQKCAAIMNNADRALSSIKKTKRSCLFCRVSLVSRHKLVYCSSRCQSNYRYKNWVISWKEGKQHGGVGIATRNISGHLKRYLHEKFDYKCSICDWSKINPITNKIPLEVDHIDGNSENNLEKNLRLLCPNCHALTPFFKNLNMGKGRKWRMDKYLKNS